MKVTRNVRQEHLEGNRALLPGGKLFLQLNQSGIDDTTEVMHVITVSVKGRFDKLQKRGIPTRDPSWCVQGDSPGGVFDIKDAGKVTVPVVVVLSEDGANWSEWVQGNDACRVCGIRLAS